MKCPLRMRHQKRPLGESASGAPEYTQDFDVCLEDGCAWWSEKAQKCVVASMFRTSLEDRQPD